MQGNELLQRQDGWVRLHVWLHLPPGWPRINLVGCVVHGDDGARRNGDGVVWLAAVDVGLAFPKREPGSKVGRTPAFVFRSPR
jgi:hypothetical protein